MKLIVGISGASGSNYAVALLKELKAFNIETHVMISEWAEYVLSEEAGFSIDDVKRLSHKFYDNKDMAADISSGSFLADGMVIIPASVKTCSEIVNSCLSTLISRRADITLRSRKPLIVCVRETPLSSLTLGMLEKLSSAGATIAPLCPGFYHSPKSISELEDFMTSRILDLLGIENKKIRRWKKETES